MKIFVLSIFLILSIFSFAQYDWDSNETPSYPELIEILSNISDSSDVINMYAMGSSDYGLPIYLCLINAGEDSLIAFKRARNETTILFNNGIHPGEPDGINAMIIWLKEVSSHPELLVDMPIIGFIPAYNIGGMMNRSGFSRANQNGPLEYGFRGNAQNLDLNRDFIKMDSKNAFTFTKIFHALDPDIFVDNHVSNGADYQYTLTYISGLRNRMAPSIEKITHESLLPKLGKAVLNNYSFDLFPYVNLVGKTPDRGISSFNDLPRYSMGYAGLFQCISFTVETHMLKSFPQRVRATYAFMDEIIKWTGSHKELIEESRLKAKAYARSKSFLLMNYQRKEYTNDSIRFKGYAHSFPKHRTTGLKRLKYDVSSPYEKSIPHYYDFTAMDSVKLPSFYYVARQEKDVIKRLKANKIEMAKIKSDTMVDLGIFRVLKYDTPNKPYEGHFFLSNPVIQREIQSVHLKKGDWKIKCNQANVLYLHSVLQPEAEDSYFTWNFFDSYLQQKEYFSSYVFIDKIDDILKNNPTLRKKYKTKRKEDSSFRESEWDQLYFIYKNSPYFEKTYNVLPVFYQD